MNQWLGQGIYLLGPGIGATLKHIASHMQRAVKQVQR
jgi:hypothetical protein